MPNHTTAQNTLENGIPIDDTVTFEMLNAEPAPIYKRWREETPVVYVKALGRILFTKSEDVYRIKTDTEHFGCFDLNTPMDRAFRGQTIMRKDGAEHLCERHAMRGAFSNDVVHNHWVPKFETLTDTLIATLPRGKTIDLNNQFAKPLSAEYLRHLLGLEDVSTEQLYRWANALLQGAMNAGFDEAIFSMNDKTNDEMDHCFSEIVKQQDHINSFSVLSTMAKANPPLEFEKMAMNMRVCIAGGLVESRDGLLSTLYGLLSHPKELQYCQNNQNWRAACEEGLRWIAPIQVNARKVLKTTSVRGFEIAKGQSISVVQASANHDEAIWQEPHIFNVRRDHHNNHSFGAGPHQCLGGDIYRALISDVILPKLFSTFPYMKFEDSKNINFNGFAFRGLGSLYVNL